MLRLIEDIDRADVVHPEHLRDHLPSAGSQDACDAQESMRLQPVGALPLFRMADQDLHFSNGMLIPKVSPTLLPLPPQPWPL